MKKGTFVALSMEFEFYIFNTDRSVFSSCDKVQLDFHTFSCGTYIEFPLPNLHLFES